MGGNSRPPGRDSHLIRGLDGLRTNSGIPELQSALVTGIQSSVMGNDSESLRLLELLREKVDLSRRSHRELEREMKLGHGTIGNLFRGKTELRLRHVAMLGRALGFDPVELLLEAYGVYRPDPPPPPGLVLTREELRALVQETVREAVREEMERFWS